MKGLYKKITGILVVCNLLSPGRPAYSQDIHFSQYANTPLLLNPAFTGDLKGNMRATTNYRSQWSSIAVPYKTFYTSYEITLLKTDNRRFLGFGVSFYNDKVGDFELNTSLLNFSFAGNLPLDRKNDIAIGVQGGFGQHSFSPAKLRWGSQYNGMNFDPNLQAGEGFYFNKSIYRDLSAGMTWNYDGNYGKGGIYSRSTKKPRANLGISLFHINRPNVSFYEGVQEKMYSKLVVHGSFTLISKRTDASLIPSFIYTTQGPSRELLLGGMFRYLLKEGTLYTGFTDGYAISFGGYFRMADAFILTTYLEFKQLSFGVSYDANISKLYIASSGRGGVEFSLKYMTPQALWFNQQGKLRKNRAKF
ncbi:MAG: PorP/SprF family type IX secretion system membrane protein [Bacteroidota bacterium]